MRTWFGAALGLAALVLATAACVSLKRTPEARFFVLQSLVEPPAAPREPVGIVGIESVLLPGHLDRPQIVTWAGPNEMRTDEFLRWGEPLGEGITRTLAEDLAGLLPDHQLVRRPWSGRVQTRLPGAGGADGLRPGSGRDGRAGGPVSDCCPTRALSPPCCAPSTSARAPCRLPGGMEVPRPIPAWRP